MHIPLIVAFGGISPAGLSSGDRGAQRLAWELLGAQQKTEMLQSLAALTGKKGEQDLLDSTFVRRIMASRFDVDNLPSHAPLPLEAIAAIELSGEPEIPPPRGWQTQRRKGKTFLLPGPDAEPLRTNKPRTSPCQSAGQLPDGFAPGAYYASRQHPLALEMTVFGMSNALGDLGMDWDAVIGALAPDRIAVFSGSAISQVDERGIGNYLTARLLGGRPSARSLAMGLGGMSADFINAYVLGTQAITGNNTGACATWLYNLGSASQLIRAGQVDLAVVGTAESQVNPYVIEAFHASSALASDERLLDLQQEQGESADEVLYRKACRPFANNVGMVPGESAQFAILMSDRLALEIGADIRAAALSTHIHADGYKYSISSPGSGNYLTVAKAMAEARAILGEQAVQRRSVILAHGTGTPQNRVTESHILSQCAAAFGIEAWPVVAIKSMLGHSMASASGDQAMAALGIASNGILPGMPSASEAAEDVYLDHLDMRFAPLQRDPAESQLVFLNAKGFGGNNATSALLGRDATLDMLRARHGDKVMDKWRADSDSTRAARADYDSDTRRGEYHIRYRHGEGVLDGIEGDIEVRSDSLRVRGKTAPVSLQPDNPFDPRNSAD